jgi:Ca2+-binding RTX toxin-like protein
LILTGTVSVNGTGNRLHNVITGNTAANILDGGAGADTLIGGLGNDTYIVDRLDTITEAVNGGTDKVVSALTYILVANVENLILSGTENLNGTGNTLNNLITGNGGANILNGDTGADTLIGGTGDDTYVADGGDMINEAVDEGNDTVQSSASHSLADNVENLILTGSVAINGTGNSLNNVITGNVVANVLNGGLGADTLIGGYGNDTYIIDSEDTIIETAIGGRDTVQVSVTYTLGSNLENLILTGIAAINGTGNTANNTLTGNSAANVLDGGAGTDTLIGGLGDDTYITDGGDMITEGFNGGTDTVLSSATHTLASHVENLTLSGAAGLGGTGNALNNRITGNDGANLLDGSTGNDTLLGGKGDDSLIGGLGMDQLSGGDGADVFVFKSANETANTLATADTIADFIQGQDRINLSTIDASASINGNNAFVWLGIAEIGTSASGELRFQKYDNEGGGNDYTLVFVDTDKDTASEFIIKLVGLYNLTANDFIL